VSFISSIFIELFQVELVIVPKTPWYSIFSFKQWNVLSDLLCLPQVFHVAWPLYYFVVEACVLMCKVTENLQYALHIFLCEYKLWGIHRIYMSCKTGFLPKFDVASVMVHFEFACEALIWIMPSIMKVCVANCHVWSWKECTWNGTSCREEGYKDERCSTWDQSDGITTDWLTMWSSFLVESNSPMASLLIHHILWKLNGQFCVNRNLSLSWAGSIQSTPAILYLKNPLICYPDINT
jgi:hypothetical protein